MMPHTLTSPKERISEVSFTEDTDLIKKCKSAIHLKEMENKLNSLDLKMAGASSGL